MSLVEKRILISVEILIDVKSINVLWADVILKDSAIISTTPHRGSYPLNEDNEVDSSVQTLLGASLTDILGEACTASQELVQIQNTMITALNTESQLQLQRIKELEDQVLLLQRIGEDDA